LQRLAIAENREVIGVLSGLDDRERGVARDLLSRVSANARIDPVALAADARARAREALIAEAQRRPRGQPWRYAASCLMDESELEEFRQRVASGEEPNMAARRALGDFASSSSDALDDVQPDPEDDPDEAPRKRKRSIRRRPLRRQSGPQRAAEGVSPPALAGPQASPEERPVGRRKRDVARPFLGGPKLFSPYADDRAYGEVIDVDHRAWRPDPPWLLSNGDETDEPDPDDGVDDHEFAETRAEA
jgi:hypothetical protein